MSALQLAGLAVFCITFSDTGPWSDPGSIMKQVPEEGEAAQGQGRCVSMPLATTTNGHALYLAVDFDYTILAGVQEHDETSRLTTRCPIGRGSLP